MSYWPITCWPRPPAQLHVPRWVLRYWFPSLAVAQSPASLTGALKHLPLSPRPSELYPVPLTRHTALQVSPSTPPTSGAASLWAAGLSSATRTRSLPSCMPGTRNTSWSRWTGVAREPLTTSTCSPELGRQTDCVHDRRPAGGARKENVPQAGLG